MTPESANYLEHICYSRSVLQIERNVYKMSQVFKSSIYKSDVWQSDVKWHITIAYFR